MLGRAQSPESVDDDDVDDPETTQSGQTREVITWEGLTKHLEQRWGMPRSAVWKQLVHTIWYAIITPFSLLKSVSSQLEQEASQPTQVRGWASNCHRIIEKGNLEGHVQTPKLIEVRPPGGVDEDFYLAINVLDEFWAEANYRIESCYFLRVVFTYKFYDLYNWEEGIFAGNPQGGTQGGLAEVQSDWASALAKSGRAANFNVTGSWYKAKLYFPYMY